MLKKNWQKTAGDNAIDAVCRIGGAATAGAVLQKLQNLGNSNVKTTVGNISGPVLTIAAVMGDLVFDNPKIRAICQGMYTMSALKSVTKIVKGSGKYIGLSGIDDEDMPAIMDGVIIDGLGSNEQTTSALPQEIAEITNADANGKVFSQVADYIDQGADGAINVSGLDGEEYTEEEEAAETETETVSGLEDGDDPEEYEDAMGAIADYAESML